MKYVLLALMMTLSLMGSEIKWAHSYEEALAQAKEENKKVLVVISTQTCRWCRKLVSTTLRDEAVVERINRDYIAVNVTRDKDVYPAELAAKAVPMSYFLDAEGTVVHSMLGYWESMDYLSILNDVDYKIKNK